MALVAYEASSEEESDYEDRLSNNVISKSANSDDTSTLLVHTRKSLRLPPPVEGDSTPTESLEPKGKELTIIGNNTSDVEASKSSISSNNNIQPLATAVDKKINLLSFVNLPTPKIVHNSEEIVEEDDEYLHKKAAPNQIEKPTITKKAPVRIMIPSLSEFKDLENDKKVKPNIGPTPKISGLLNLLPRPKHEQFFSKPDSCQTNNSTVQKALIPDSVKNRQTIVTKQLQNPLKPQVKKSLDSNISDSEETDSDEDFFSLNSKQELPAVSLNEINSMVAKKVAHMAETSSKFNNLFAQIDKTEDNFSEIVESKEREEIQFDEKALHALVGSRAKRRKVEVNVVELSSEQVLPNKNEWLRTALAQATTYQPKGVLVDEEPVPGTRKKHQITYLAHQAKANEQELQAMWATNRHTRRQTQSKYGF